MLNLAVLLEDSARAVPDRDAVVHGGTRMSYSQLDAAASQVAAGLAARGIGRGDQIALSCPNLPYFPIVYYGILKSGATVVPLNVLLTEREIAYHLADSAAKAYFCFEGTPELPLGQAGLAAYQRTPGCEHFVLLTANPAATSPSAGAETLAEFVHRQPATFLSAPTAETDTAVILYTSGTTGQPKGAELTHSNMVQNALLANRLFGLHPHDVHLITLPLFHSFGQTVQLNAGFATGATVVLLPRFDPGQALALMEREQVTFFAGVPTMYHALLNCKDTPDIEAIAARRGDAAVRGTLRRADPGGLRPVRDQPGGHVQPGGPAAPARLGGPAGVGGPGQDHRGRRFRGRPRRAGGGRDPRPQRDEGLLPAAGGDRGGDRRRGLVPHRRHRHPRRRGLPVHRGPEEGHDHPGRVQRVPAGTRRGAAHAPGGEPGRGRRGAPPQPWRGGQGVRGPRPGRGAHRGRTDRLVQAEHGGLQVPADRGVP